MANKVNNWREILGLANANLKKYDAEIGVYEHDDVYSVSTVVNGKEEEYADNYYEDELQDLINDAWVHARAKAKAKSETIYSEVKCTAHGTMEHKVKMTIELTVDAPENKTKEEVEGFAYWLIEPLLEETKTSKYDFDGCKLNEFDITINN